MILYHFTSMIHMEGIRRQARLRRTESNLSVHQAHAGPPVVWLTTSPDPRSAGGHLWGNMSIPDDMVHPDYDKTRIRITVEVPDEDVSPWLEWARTWKMDPTWQQIVIAAGGGQQAAESWYVTERDVREPGWVSIEDLREGEDWV